MCVQIHSVHFSVYTYYVESPYDFMPGVCANIFCPFLMCVGVGAVCA